MYQQLFLQVHSESLNYVNFYIKLLFYILKCKFNKNLLKIALYLFSVGILCMLSLIGNVIVLNLYGRDVRIETDMPIWVKNK